MAAIKENTEDFDIYLENREYIANRYVMKCFFITMVFYVVSFVLNILDIFVVDQKVMESGFYPSLFIYFVIYFVSKKVPLSNENVKYFILFAVMVVYTIMGVTITYHVVLASLLPFLYATLYSSPKIMRFVYILTVISTLVIVYGGYYWGLCDANMALLTTGRLQDYVENGHFILTKVNENPIFTLFLFFVMPRCLIYFAFVFVCNNILRIVSGSIEKAKLTDELEKAKVEAERANMAKSKFLARMSHEIRTPINAIFGMNEMILRESNEPVIRKYAKDAKDSSVILLNIINEILDSSKIESGMMELVPVNYKMGSLLNDLYNMMSVRAKEKKLELIFDVDARIPSELYGDDKRLRQVLINLLSNAVKYTNQGQVVLKVTCDVVDDKAILHYSVKDTGIGIKEEDIDKLYEEFKRIDLGRNRNIEGSGLGMNIAQQFLKLMGSELQIKSEYEKGSEFYFDVEQKIIDRAALGDFRKRCEQAVETKEERMIFVAPEAKILVVDDVAMNRFVFKSLLKQTRMQIFEAESGSACLDMLKQQHFDIVFLDHMMPEMDGIETKHKIEEEKLCVNTPIIMLTANASLADREIYIQEGFDDFLSKPVLVKQLEQMILKYLPETLLSEGEEEEENTSKQENVELPKLEEFDFEYAKSLVQKEELVYKFLMDFHASLEPLMEKLSMLYANIGQEEGLKVYRTEVHALKSTSATVGALLLSKLARLLEKAAIEKDAERIEALHPILLDEMKKHKERIETILTPIEEKALVQKVETAYLDMLSNSLENAQFDVADLICGEIQKNQYPENIQVLIEMLVEKVFQLDADEALKIIREIKNKQELIV
ncbi:MAG: response regulator [Lachnospiraceae bacterium]|nr:response regulator [Lachnospiraceae bacterium]